jgi:hypothetical protein
VPTTPKLPGEKTICCEQLTTCHVIDNGAAIALGLVDETGQPVWLRLRLDHAGAVAMTLPRLLTQALEARTGQKDARYVLPLGRWSLEAGEDDFLVMTLATVDGFQVAFRVPLDTSQALSWALRHEAKELRAAAGGAEIPQSPAKIEYN